MRSVLRNGYVFDPSTHEAKRMDVFIDGQSIAYGCAKSGSCGSRRVVDCSNCLITPGLIDAHTHLYQTFGLGLMEDLPLTQWLPRIWAYESGLDGEELYYSTLSGCMEAIRTGTTCVSEMAGYFNSDSIVRAIRDSGLRARVGRFVSDLSEAANTPRQGVSQAVRASEEFAARWHGSSGGRISVCFAPRGWGACSFELMREIGKASEEMGLGVHTHVAEGKENADCVKEALGCGSIRALQRANLLRDGVQLAHAIWLDPGDAELIRDSGVSLVHCPKSNMKLIDGIAPVHELREKGVDWALGCDGGASNGSYDMREEARVAALLQKIDSGYPGAIPAGYAFDMLTAAGAGAVGMRDSIGAIEPGKKAEVVIWRYSRSLEGAGERPIADFIYSGQLFSVRTVIIDGEFVYDDDRFLNVDERKVDGIVKSAHSVTRKMHG